MKTLNLKVKWTLYFILIAVLAGFIFSCEHKVNTGPVAKEEVLITENSSNKTVIVPCEGNTPATYNLIAGQHIHAGTISVFNSEDMLFVTYATNGGWMLCETHLYVGNIENVPLNKNNNPKTGHFPYKDTFNFPASTYTYSIPVEELDECFVIAAHAVVCLRDNEEITDSQTAWGEGNTFTNKGSWAMYFEYCKQVCE